MFQRIGRAQLVCGGRDLDSRGHRFPVHGDGGRRIRVERGGDVNLERAVVVGGGRAGDVRVAKLADGVCDLSIFYRRIVGVRRQSKGKGLVGFPLFQRVAGGQFICGARYVDGSGYRFTIHRDFHIGHTFKCGCYGGGREFSVVVCGSRAGDGCAAKIADGVCDLSISYRCIVGVRLQGKGKGPGIFPLRQLVAGGQRVCGTRDGDGRLYRSIAQGDACLCIRAERGGNVVDLESAVAAGSGRTRYVGIIAEAADGVVHVSAGDGSVVSSLDGEGHSLGRFPLFQCVGRIQRIAGARDADGCVRLFSIHGDGGRRCGTERGGDAIDRKLTAAVGLGRTREVGVIAETADGVAHVSAGHRLVVTGFQGKGQGLGRFPLREPVGRAQTVIPFVDGEWNGGFLPAYRDFHGLRSCGQSRQVGYRELPVCAGIFRRGQIAEVGVIQDGHGNVGYYRSAGSHERKGHVRGLVPEQRVGRGRQLVSCGRNGEGHLGLAFAVHQNLNRLLSGEDGGQARDLELPAGVGDLCVRRQAGKALALREQYAQTGHRLAVARQRKGDVMLFMLIQGIFVGVQHIGCRRDGELRLCRGLAVYLGRERLFPGENGGQTRYGEIPAAVRGVCSRQSREGGAGIEDHARPGHGRAVLARDGKLHVLRLVLDQRVWIGFQVEFRKLRIQIEVAGSFPGLNGGGYGSGRYRIQRQRKFAVAAGDERGEVRPVGEGGVGYAGMNHLAGHGLVEAVHQTEVEAIGSGLAHIFDAEGVFGPVFKNNLVFTVYELMPRAAHGAQFRHLGGRGLLLQRHAEMIVEGQPELGIRASVFGALLAQEGGNQRNRRVFDAVGPDTRILFQIARAVHPHVVAVPAGIGTRQRHVAVEGQIRLDARIPSFGRTFFHKRTVEVVRTFPVRQREVVVGGQAQPVVLQFRADPAPLVRAGEVVVEEGVVADHQRSGVVVRRADFPGGEGEPALPQTEVADPACLLVVGHAARTDLGEDGGIGAVIPGEQGVALTGHVAVAVETIVQAGASAVHQAGQNRLAPRVHDAGTVVQAAIQEQLIGVKTVELPRGLPGNPSPGRGKLFKPGRVVVQSGGYFLLP